MDIASGHAKDKAERRDTFDALIAGARTRFHALQVIGVLTQDQASSILQLLERGEKKLSQHDRVFHDNIIRYLRKEADFVSVFAEMLQIDPAPECPEEKSQGDKLNGKSGPRKPKRDPRVSSATPGQRMSLPAVKTFISPAIIAAGAVLLAVYAVFPPGGGNISPQTGARRVKLDAAAASSPPVPAAAIFPSSIAPSHAGEEPYEAALNTCYDQFKANRETNANGGLKWNQNGTGYYSECLKRLNP
ncbi:hypothetical protein QEV83_17370 [Methylocapsa sp. D3K7]|uniref:hypothetical protein n=1 Tax=Methylocapsa sp. D3K7 TaxID=3041435 RepID=UPI00244E5FE1|nr:hypothetical protein [Methylocapsa sp. D3K7]WGJ14387.1 hypothetical protein QEV83_17370 [Methylocapsa sp. D3K7]